MAKGQQDRSRGAGRGSGEETGRGSGGAERARNGREGDMSDLSKWLGGEVERVMGQWLS